MSETTNAVPYTVVVGVSITSKSPAALGWAAAQARANHGRLVAVRVLKAVTAEGSPDNERAREQAAEQLRADVEATLGANHGAQLRVVYGGRRKALLAVSRDADLLVIGTSRSPSPSSRLIRRVISAATCPVVVMPPALSGEPPSGLSRAGRSVGEAALRAVGTSGRPGYRPPTS